jgi:hypothetical protein
MQMLLAPALLGLLYHGIMLLPAFSKEREKEEAEEHNWLLKAKFHLSSSVAPQNVNVQQIGFLKILCVFLIPTILYIYVEFYVYKYLFIFRNLQKMWNPSHPC